MPRPSHLPTSARILFAIAMVLAAMAVALWVPVLFQIEASPRAGAVEVGSPADVATTAVNDLARHLETTGAITLTVGTVVALIATHRIRLTPDPTTAG